jgi:hypothetical protein
MNSILNYAYLYIKALGTFYIEPASQQLLAAATGQTPAQIANQFGQQQILVEHQQQQSSDYTVVLQVFISKSLLKIEFKKNFYW